MNVTLGKEATKEKLPEWVLKEYDFYPNKIEHWDQLTKLTCHQGSYALKKTKETNDQLQFVSDQLDQLKEKGFSHSIPFTRNKFGDSFVTSGSQNYYVLPWQEHITARSYRESWEVDVLKALGQMHTFTQKEAVDQKQLLLVLKQLTSQQIRWSKRIQQMMDFFEFAQQRNILSPVEHVFVQYFDYLQRLGKKACYYINAYKTYLKKGGSIRFVLCHGQINRKHVIQTEQSFYFIHFDQATMDLPARELALFFRRHSNVFLEETGPFSMAWLEAYEQAFPLEQMEKLLLIIYLLFPERVFKEIETYYQGERDWHPVKYAMYVEKQIKETRHILKFIREFITSSQLIQIK
jgi:spore coat protein YsxE